MSHTLFVHKKIARTSYRSLTTGYTLFELIKVGLLSCVTIILVMMFLFLTSTSSTAGHALNKALKSFDYTMQLHAQAKYQIAGINDIVIKDAVKIPTTNLGYQKNIVAVGETNNFALNR